MKNIIISIIIVFALMIFPFGGLFSSLFKFIIGGGVEQSFIYPIYLGIIILVAIIVGATNIILDEIKQLKRYIEISKDGKK